MHSFWSGSLFFHSWGNFSFSGHSLSTNFFHRLAEPSMSRSRFLNCSMFDRALIPPHPMLERKSTGLVTFGMAGNRSRNSSSIGSICLLISKIYYFGGGGTRTPHGVVCHYITPLTWKVTCEVKISLSLSNSPRVVYINTEYVMLSMRFSTLCLTSGLGSALSMALWNTTLKAYGRQHTHYYDFHVMYC